MSFTDIIFCTNQNVISKHWVDVSIFDKCHNGIINGKVSICVPVPLIYVREAWDAVRQMLKILKKQYLTLVGIKPLKISP